MGSESKEDESRGETEILQHVEREREKSNLHNQIEVSNLRSKKS